MKKKMMSLVLAMTMILSALPAASAVSAEPLSKYAGMTVPVQVVEETENGLTSRVINVAIPEGATEAEENALVCAAAVGRASGEMRSINATPAYIISSMGSVTLRNNIEQKVGGGKPANASYDDVDEIVIAFEVTSLSQTNAMLAFDLRSSTTPSSTTGWKSMRPNVSSTEEWKVVFVSHEFKTLSNYNGGIDVYAKALYNEMIVLSSVFVFGYVD